VSNREAVPIPDVHT